MPFVSYIHIRDRGVQSGQVDQQKRTGRVEGSQGRVCARLWMPCLKKGAQAGQPLQRREMVRRRNIRKLLGTWIRAVFSRKLPNIIKGNFNRLFGRKDSLFRKRMEKCSRCQEAELVGGLGIICGICGCPLESKLRDPGSECGKGLWGKEE